MADLHAALRFFQERNWTPYPFQQETWQAYLEGKNGLLNAPTGSGKTYALWLACLLDALENDPKPDGLTILWITPLRALANDICEAMKIAAHGMGLDWYITVRSGDTKASEKAKQKQTAPQCLITTPESLHILLSQKGHEKYFRNLKAVIVDEWHELLGSKRGVQIELGLSRLKSFLPALRIWGISATIGNMEEATDVLLGPHYGNQYTVIRADISKTIVSESIIPVDMDHFPWSGHLGTRLLPQLLETIRPYKSVLIFTNTRSQTEIWYQKILDFAPELAGSMAMHHGSLDMEVRSWVENALHEGKLKIVVCTASLDLGLDFRPVEAVVQIGGPKGVSRYFQRAGRSGHQPDATSKVYFVPTHALELIEGSALRRAIEEKTFESRIPLQKSYDVLVQYLVTLAIGDGFYPESLLKEIRNTYCYRTLTDEEWQWALDFITTGGQSLTQYDEFHKVEVASDGKMVVTSRKIATRHRLSMGTIVSDPMLKVKFQSGGYLGVIEESFISRLSKGDTFWFAGRPLEFIRLRDMTVHVKKSSKKTGLIPQWMGGRMPLSSQLSDLIREEMERAINGDRYSPELKAVEFILQLQEKWSYVPRRKELLIESVHTREGHHIFCYPFEGRGVHELLMGLVGYRISRLKPLSFSTAMNDYGFELLSDQEIPVEEALELDLFREENLWEDIAASLNEAEMAKRRFRDIAAIAGLVFTGYPGKTVSNKHLQANSSTIYQVFESYDPDNLLIAQSKEEVMTFQLEKTRFLAAMKTINQSKIVFRETEKPSPFSFPILTDRLRGRMSNESVEDKLMRLQHELEML